MAILLVLLLVMVIMLVLKYRGHRELADFVIGACYAIHLLAFITNERDMVLCSVFTLANLFTLFCYDIKYVLKEASYVFEVTDTAYEDIVENTDKTLCHMVFAETNVAEGYDSNIGFKMHGMVSTVDNLGMNATAVVSLYGVSWNLFKMKRINRLHVKIFLDEYLYEKTKEKLGGK